NRPIGLIQAVDNPDELTLARAGDTVKITFEQPPRRELPPGTALYYGSDPSGLGLAVPRQESIQIDFEDSRYIVGSRATPALVVRSQDASGVNPQYTLINTGGLPVARPPQKGDYVFVTPTSSNWPTRIAWSVLPNLQTFWLVDAVTQGSKIPPRYVGMLAGYTGAQTIGLLCLAILLFQRRDVG